MMGCGASNRAAVVPEAAEAASGEAQQDDLRVSSAGSERQLGAATPARPAYVGVVPLGAAPSAPDASPPPGPPGPPMAFEVPVLEESLIKKHPPKRFQRLEEQQVPNLLSLEVLEERQEVARNRRIQILNQRVQSAKMRLPKKTRIMDDGVTAVDETIESVCRENSSVEL